MARLTRYLSRLLGARFAFALFALVPSLWAAAPLLWKTPLSHDHPSHLFKAWHFWTEMLGRGRLGGWSHFWAFGFPSDELYPCGGEVWVALFRIATLGQLSWMRTYALAFAGFLLFKALAVYCFTKAYFRIPVAIACAWIAALDPGAMLQGGWQWHTTFGVWPVSLAMSMVLLAFVALERAQSFGRTRHVFWAGLWVAAALLTHPVAMVALAVSAPLFVLDSLLRQSDDGFSGATRAAFALALGVALAAFYLLPVFSRGDEIMDLGWLEYTLPDVLRRLVLLRTFDHVWPPIHALAIVGAVLMVVRRRRGAVFFVSSAAVLVFLSSDTLVRGLHLERAFPALIKIEFNRMLLLAKLFWFPLAAYGLVEAMRSLRRACLGFGKRARGLAWAAGLTLACALVVPGFWNFYRAQIEKRIQGEHETRYWADFQAFLLWSREAKLHDRDLYRIAYDFHRHNHLASLAPVFNETPVYKLGYTTSQIFNGVPMTDEPEVLEALSVKYVLSESELGNPDLVFERKFGDLWLYRFSRYRSDPFTLQGAGRAELVELAPERIRIRITGSNEHSRLKIHVARAARWRATLSGVELPISIAPVYGVEYPFLMEVPARDGELELRYVYRPANWIGLLITLLAIPTFGAVVWLERRGHLCPSWRGRPARAVRLRAWPLLAALAGLVGIVVLIKLRSRSALLPRTSVFHHLDDATVTLGEHPCVKAGDLDFTCGPHALRAEVVSGAWGVHSCMSAPDAGPLRVAARMKLGSFLAGRYDPAATDAGSLRVSVDGQSLGTVETRPPLLLQQYIQFDTRAFVNREVEVELVLTGAALHCFDFRIVP